MGDLMVGRERESTALDAALADVGSATRAVLVTGEAGIGKTTLVGAFLKRVADAGTHALTGSCLPTVGRDLPFAPVAQMLRAFKHDHPDVVDAALDPQSAAVLTGIVPDLAAPAITAPAPPQRSAGLERARLLTALAGFVAEVAQRGPLVVALDDLQWADGPTLALLEIILRGTPPAGVLMVLTAREPSLPLQTRQWYATERVRGTLDLLRLPPLTPAEAELLVASLGRSEASARWVNEVHRLSGGNPLLIRELALEESDRTPDAVHGVTVATLDAISAAGRDVVGLVAVAGRPLKPALVAAGLGDFRASAGVRDALSSGLVIERDGWYCPGHELVRAVVLAALRPAELTEHHLTFARALAQPVLASQVPGDAAEIAWHFHQAGAGEDACVWSLSAGTAAEAIGAFAAAQVHLGRAADLVATGDVSMAEDPYVLLLRRCAAAADRAGNHAEALRRLDTALTMSDPGTDPQLVASLLGHRSWLLMVLNRIPEAYASAHAAVDALPADAEPTTRASVLLRLAMLHNDTGRHDEAVALAEEALSAATLAGDDALAGRAMRDLANARAAVGALDEAVSLFQEATRRARAAGDAEAIALAGVSLSDRLLNAGRYEGCAAAAQQARSALLTVAESGHWLDSMLACNAAAGLIGTGHWDQAAELVDEAMASDTIGFARMGRARIRIARGDFAGADQDLQAIDHLKRHDTAGQGLEYDELLVELRIWQRRPDDALAAALSVLDDVGMELLRERGKVLSVLGLRAAADVALDAGANRPHVTRTETARAAARLAAVASSALVGETFLQHVAAGELGRLHGQPDVAAWAAAAAEASTDLRVQPHWGAYAHWRTAEAMLDTGRPRAEAAGPLRAAAGLAERLGARPLVEEITGLAVRARIRLHDESRRRRGTPAGDPAPDGLTERERQVLRLLVRGCTNREIGQILFMSPKTASVHVSRLMAKLGVQNRVQAAGVAHRLELVEPDPALDLPGL
jgi:DNA-binding CsgD family transcriptional regulator/tetratricopeptide (TPR) repeat protein